MYMYIDFTEYNSVFRCKSKHTKLLLHSHQETWHSQQAKLLYMTDELSEYVGFSLMKQNNNFVFILFYYFFPQ